MMRSEVGHHQSFSLLTMVPDIYSFAVEENEYGDEEHLGNVGIGTGDDIDIGKSLYNERRLDVRPTHNSDLTNLDTFNCRPSRRVTIPGGPALKSSLQSRSRLGTSQTSIESDLSEEFSQMLNAESVTKDARRAAKEGKWVRCVHRLGKIIFWRR